MKTLYENLDRMERALFPHSEKDELSWVYIERLWKTIREQIARQDVAHRERYEQTHGTRFDALS